MLITGFDANSPSRAVRLNVAAAGKKLPHTPLAPGIGVKKY